jgi:hypothetical protein
MNLASNYAKIKEAEMEQLPDNQTKEPASEKTDTLPKAGDKKGAGDRVWVVVLAGTLVVRFLFALMPTDQLPSPTLKAITILIELAMVIGLIGSGVRVLRPQTAGRSMWGFVLVIGLLAGFGLLVIRLNGGPRVELPPRSAQSSPPPDVSKDLNELVESTKPLREALRQGEALAKDLKSGQVTQVEPPQSQEKKVDFLDLAKTHEVLANIREDFGPNALFMEITIIHDSAFVRATAPGKPDEIRRYTYNAKDRAEPDAPGFPQSPFDANFKQNELFSPAELQGFEPRLADLAKRTIDRLRIPEGKIKNLSFYRRSPFYPRNNKFLLEIWCEGSKGLSGRVVYDVSGAEFDIVTPSGLASDDTSPPNFKLLGTTDATADRVARFDTLFTSFLTLSQKYGDTRWSKMRVSAPDKVLTLPREEFRKWTKVQRELLDCVNQILKIFAEHHPPSDAIMSSKAAAHASKREFWESHRKVWDASCQQSNLLDKNWADWVAHGFPAAEAKYKPWQKEVMRLQSEISAAQQRIDELSPAHK